LKLEEKGKKTTPSWLKATIGVGDCRLLPATGGRERRERRHNRSI